MERNYDSNRCKFYVGEKPCEESVQIGFDCPKDDAECFMIYSAKLVKIRTNGENSKS
jgi:hypothetical protein